jgi:hypothetical protein
LTVSKASDGKVFAAHINLNPVEISLGHGFE